KQLIDEQFPTLSPASVNLLGSGWDNTVFRVNEQFVFRFPRRDVATPLIETELHCLPILAGRLPAAIPLPVFAGRPSSTFPWPFAGYPYIVGRSAHRAELDLSSRRSLATSIADFLKRLHTIPLDALPDGAAPLDTLSRLDARRRRPTTAQRLTF